MSFSSSDTGVLHGITFPETRGLDTEAGIKGTEPSVLLVE